VKALRRLAVAALIGLICFGVMQVLTSYAGFLTPFEWRTYDLRFRTRVSKPLPKLPQIALIGIDDRTRETLPWSMGRMWHTYLLRPLCDVLPGAIGYDILFKQRVFEKAYEGNAAIEEMTRWDTDFRQALMTPEPQAVLAYNFVLPETEESEQEGAVVIRPTAQELENSAALLKRFEITKITGPVEDLIEAEDPALPDPKFADVAQLGFINAPSDSDGVRRRLPLVIRWRLKDPATGRERDAVFPSLTLLMVATFLELRPVDIEVDVGKEIRLPTPKRTYVIPTDKKGRLLVNFAGPTTEAFEVFSFAQVVKWGGPPASAKLEQFADKMVFIGEMGTGTVDTKPTPIGEETPLVAMHLNAARSILAQQFVRETVPAAKALILLACCLLTAVVSAATSPRTSLLAAIALLLGYGLIAWHAFGRATLVLPMIAPMGGIALSSAAVIFYRYLTEERQKLWIRKALGRYLSPNIMAEVLADPSRLRLGGERRTLTVLFSDIRDFTPFCESREPEEVVAVLNEYLTEMTQQIFKHSGTLDKYVGDEIVAFFGAPGTEHPDHAIHAARAALDMKATLGKLQDKWRGEGREPLDFGVGLNTGEVLVGNMGSTDIFDYTVIGDQVNVGARVEALTRDYGCHIIITEATLNEIRDHAEVRELGETTVKGKAKPVKVFELVGLKEA
jgi:adenylate cyclase